jgi:hypothetical protein
MSKFQNNLSFHEFFQNLSKKAQKNYLSTKKKICQQSQKFGKKQKFAKKNPIFFKKSKTLKVTLMNDS